MKKLLLLCFMSLFFSVAHAQSQSENQQVDYPVSDGQSLRFAIPSNWEVRANPQPYELRFSSANPETVTDIFVYKKEDLAELFAQFGEVISARIIFNRETRRSKGYGFVEMPNESEGNAAIAALNGSEHMGRTINVAVANERPPREE